MRLGESQDHDLQARFVCEVPAEQWCGALPGGQAAAQIRHPLRGSRWPGGRLDDALIRGLTCSNCNT